MISTGSEHGLPTLPNLFTDQILTIHVDLVLANKFILQGVLDIIPSKIGLTITKKFLGMHESQEETMHLTVEGMQKGLYIISVCYLSQYLSCHEIIPTMMFKQGNPPIYNHSSKEVLFNCVRGFDPPLISGISSLPRPMLSGILLTHCSGVGHPGRCPTPSTGVQGPT